MAQSEQEPLMVRALVLGAGTRRVAIVLADLMVVTEELDQRLERRLADLHLDATLFFATHTHSSVGGFDTHVVAQLLALGPYRSDVAEDILNSAEKSVRQAARRVGPIRLYTATTRLRHWAWNRSTPGAPVDDALNAVFFREDSGDAVATLVVVAAHPTLFPGRAPQLSPDYPGVAMDRLEKSGGVALLLQGAEGDAAAPGEGWLGIQGAGSFVAGKVAEAAALARPAEPRLACADVRIDLPRVDVKLIGPFALRRPASNLAAWLLPRSTRVGVLRIGDLTLLTTPGEPTELAARHILADVHPDPGAEERVVALAQDYISYIDIPERVDARSGEARRAWYGPGLLPAVTGGLERAVESTRETPPR